MANPPDQTIDPAPEAGDAAEYVLGTLDAESRRAAASRMATDDGFAEAVRVWEGRLSPLAELAAEARPAIPPAWVWPAIEARLPGGVAVATGTPPASGTDTPAPREANVIELRQRVRYWRGTAALAGVAAAAMLALLVAPPGVVPFDPRPAARRPRREPGLRCCSRAATRRLSWPR